MTTYQGGKKRLGKRIYDEISNIEKEITLGKKLPYFEPFVGMGGVLRHFSKEEGRDTFACDINPDLMMMWKELQGGWKPPKKCSRKKFEKLKASEEHSAERGYLGVVASWSGIFFAAYRLDYNKNKDFLGEAYRGLMNIKPDIMSVNFIDSAPYYNFNPRGMLIYCDPPYFKNNFQTAFFSEFNHDLFWEVMRNWSEHNIVVISESSAPCDFKEVWSSVSTFANLSATKKYNDCLYMYKEIPRISSLKNSRLNVY